MRLSSPLRALGCCALLACAFPAAAQADVYETGFEPPVFAPGAIVGENGWTSLFDIDASVIETLPGMPASFGDQSLQVSNARVTSEFQQLRTPALLAEAGESEATSGPQAGSERYSRFDASFSFATAVSSHQPGLSLHVAPDDGFVRRTGVVRIRDLADGLSVESLDPVDNGPDTSVTWPDYHQIAAGLNRSMGHTLRIVVDYADGPSNDILQIYVDGGLVHTTVSWEQYYRHDPEQASLGNEVPTANALLFHARSGSDGASPDLEGEGFLFDDVRVEARATPQDPPVLPRPADPAPPRPAPVGDVRAPELRIGGSPRAHKRLERRGFMRRREVRLHLRCDERCSLRATGRLSLRAGGKPVRLRAVRRTLRAGTKARIALRLSPRARTLLRRALRRGKRVNARVVVRVRDRHGNLTEVVRTIRLGR